MKIYNTMTHQKEEFEPLRAGKVSMYVCGPTVYNFIHVGNARTFLSFDVIRRYLEWRGFDVTFIQNITDVDDKIIKRANEEGRKPEEVAADYTAAFVGEMRAMGVSDPTVRPKATEGIPDMLAFIEKLIAGGHAYATDSGDVYFSVRSYPKYGQLSRRNVDELRHGARIEVDEQKRDPLDFALWKAAKPGEPAWESPWGAGRPGWHIECSAMSDAELGIPFDIHGGGVDLVFPHHENEIAQTEAATGKPMARYWMHGGMLQTGGEKMSKSLGNFLLLRELLESYEVPVIRLLMLQTHYRSPIDFSDERLREAGVTLERVQSFIDRAAWVLQVAEEPAVKRVRPRQMVPSAGATGLQAALTRTRNTFIAEMDDDFNTAGALGVLFDLIRQGNSFLDTLGDEPLDEYEVIALQGVLNALLELFSALGVALEPSLGCTMSDDAEAEQLLEERTAARAAKDWARADEIRDRLDELGYVVKDTPQGPQLAKR